MLAEQYFPSKIQIPTEDDMLMLATKEEEIDQMFTSFPLEYMLENDPVLSE